MALKNHGFLRSIPVGQIIALSQYLVRGGKYGRDLKGIKVGVRWVSRVCVCERRGGEKRGCSEEDSISRGPLVSLPGHINQHAACGRNELENKKSIKVSE